MRHLCVTLHDVAPVHWPGCVRVVSAAQAVAARLGVSLPMTLLVVPSYHGVDAAPNAYLHWLRQLVRSGHEIALHGLTHRDEARPAQGLRRWRADGEREFATLDFESAVDRLVCARAWAQRHGLAAEGFVAPAWELNEASWAALCAAGFTHTCTQDRIVSLPGGQALVARSLVYSSRSIAHRQLSRVLNGCLALQQRHAPLCRLDLHPADADHPGILRSWSRWLAGALETRRALRLSDAAGLALPAPAAAPAAVAGAPTSKDAGGSPAALRRA